MGWNHLVRLGDLLKWVDFMNLDFDFIFDQHIE